MDIGSIFLILGLLIIAGLYISRPFFEQRSTAVGRLEHDRSSLLAERDRILNTLQELDLDYALGKIPTAEYPAQRAALLEQGAQVLRSLDALRARLPSQDGAEPRDAEVALRTLTAPNANGRSTLASPDDQLEALIASRRREREGKASGFCPRCGNPVQKSDRFCPKCGFKIV